MFYKNSLIFESKIRAYQSVANWDPSMGSLPALPIIIEAILRTC